MKKLKNQAPKSLNWRKFLKISIWMLVIFWTLGSLRGFSLAAKLNGQEQNQEKVSPIVKHENPATSVGAQAFTQNFLKEYLTWNKDNYQERADRLKPYIRKGIDEQAGLRFDTLTGSSSPEKTESWEISETGKDTALLTFRTTHTVNTIAQTKDANGKVQKKQTKIGPFEQWIQVPIITDGKSFLVNGLPTFVGKPAAADIKPIQDVSKPSDVPSRVNQEVNQLLTTFFKQYSTGTLEELQYLTTDDNIRPLEGSLVFKEFQSLEVNKKQKTSYTYIATATAIFIENNSKAQILQKYKIEVSEKNGQWQVTEFNK